MLGGLNGVEASPLECVAFQWRRPTCFIPLETMSAQPTRIPVVIVEDEAVLREELAFQLGHMGFAVETFENASQLYRYLAASQTPLVVLDIGLDGEDGLSVCQYLRAHDSRIGIVFVTARSLRDQRIQGLEAGADAYLVKPIDIDELALILRRLAERSSWPAVERRSSPVARPVWSLDETEHELLAPNGGKCALTLTELRLLRVLTGSASQTCTYAQLGVALGIHPDELDKHRIEVIVSRLRSKITRATGLAAPLRTDRSLGYRWA